MTVLLVLAGSVLCAAAAPAGDSETGKLEPAAGRFLVATRGLYGPYFSRTVIYLTQHNSEGTAGVIVNRRLGKKVVDVLPEMHSSVLGSYPLYNGGPVSQGIMVMLFRDNHESEQAVHVSGDVYASSSSAVLARLMMAGKPGKELRMYAGQAGWAPGQLAREIEQDSWHVMEADTDAIFSDDSDYLWQKLINVLDPQGIMVLNRTGPAPAHDYNPAS